MRNLVPRQMFEAALLAAIGGGVRPSGLPARRGMALPPARPVFTDLRGNANLKPRDRQWRAVTMPKIRPFGQRLRPAREAREVTRKQLAAILGVAQGTIVNWEINGAEPTART